MRVFSNLEKPGWYPEIITKLIKPVFAILPTPTLFFSRYQSGRDGDNGDTDIERLPPDFIDNEGFHKSIRIRFRGFQVKEQITHAIINNQKYWYSEFLNYNPIEDLANTLWSPDQDQNSRRRRSKLVAEFLSAHSRLVADAVKEESGKAFFEINSVNKWTTRERVTHMIDNVWKDDIGWDIES